MTPSPKSERTHVRNMTDGQMLEAIWAVESTYRTDLNRERDHRRFLKRRQLERIYLLSQKLRPAKP